MDRRPVTRDRAAYLACDDIFDFDHPALVQQAAELRDQDERATARRCFEFVRDQVEHSADFRRSPTTCSASEVLLARTGFCYAKSHLLAALLRANGLAAGLCYQRLTVEGSTAPFCLHGLVAVELPALGWYAVDARGNKREVAAAFEPPREQLAFAIEHPGERDFPFIYARPLPAVVHCLRSFATWQAVLANLPDALELPSDGA
jgi:transglutaminase-like putative cysteine protease